MYIQPISNSINMQGAPKPKGNSGALKKITDRIKQKVIDMVPERTVANSAKDVIKWTNWNRDLSHPATNRLIMGATAIITQPVIDYNNHKVDKETREVSRNRTIAKIVVGALVGIMVRGSAFELVSKMTNIKGTSRFSRALLPKKHLRELIKDSKLMDNYRNALATLTAILAMCVTNFVIDAPLTVHLTNHLNKRTNLKKQEKQNLQQEKERLVLNG